MRVERVAAAAEARALVPGGGSVADAVAEIVGAVRAHGDTALRDFVARYDNTNGAQIRVGPDELRSALTALDAEVAAGLRLAIENVRAVAAAQCRAPTEVILPQGQTVTVREVPVRRAAIYVPGGRAPYPSTVIMGAITAQAAGVESVAVCAPGSHPVILAACALCGVAEVWRMGGAHAVAAFAYGTESVELADVIAGPGNLFVAEAKRQVSGDVGIDGFLGPSDVLVLALGAGVPEDFVVADLLAQAEHGDGTVVVLAADDAGLLDRVEAALRAAPDTGAVAALARVAGAEEGLAFADAFAPEHLELLGAGAEGLADRVRAAGCVFVGASGATAFGDYVAGSNHSLPTGGSARFASALGVSTFRRRMSVVRIGDAADGLADAGAAIAEAEGFSRHAESMRMRKDCRP